MILKRNITIKSNLTPDEIMENLAKYTVNYGSRPNNRTKFVGKLDMNNHSFLVLPTFDYNVRNQSRPEIIGNVKQSEDGQFRLIQLEFIFPRDVKALLITFTCIYLVFLGLVAILPLPKNVDPSYAVIAIPIALLGMLLSALAVFSFKSSESIKIFKLLSR